MQKLKKWHRLGIVLSIVWFLYAFIKARNEELQIADKITQLSFDACSIDHSFQYCWEQRTIAYDRLFQPNWINLLLTALVPIVATWIVIYIGLYCYKWIMKGK